MSLEDVPPQAGELVLDLEPVEAAVIGYDATQQLLQLADAPLTLSQFG